MTHLLLVLGYFAFLIGGLFAPETLFKASFLTTLIWVSGLTVFLFSIIANFPTLLLLNQSLISSPRILESFFKSLATKAFRGFSPIYLFGCLALAMIQTSESPPFLSQKEAVLFFITLTFVQFELIHLYFSNLFKHLDSKEVLKFYKAQGEILLRGESPADGLEWVDTLCETGTKKLALGNIREAEEASQQILELGKSYLKSKQGQLLHVSRTEPVFEEIQFFSHYFSKQFESLYENALNHASQKYAGTLVNQVGKFCLALGEVDPTLTGSFLNLLKEFALKGLLHHQAKIAIQAHCFLKEITLQWLSKEPGMLSPFLQPASDAVFEMQEIAEEIFRFDKGINPNILKFPFVEIEERISKLPKDSVLDIEALKNQLEKTIKNFEALGQIMQRMPQDDNASDRQD